MRPVIPKTPAGVSSIIASLKLTLRAGPWAMFRGLFSKNACKSCALGMGGQKGGMHDEKGGFPQVCKKSFFAQASDLQGAVPETLFQNNSVHTLAGWSPRDLEHCGRLTRPLWCGADDAHYRPLAWEDALDRVVDRLKSVSPDRSFFYASGRSSNEAGFLLQLFARLLGTNNVNNCSYYCHQASGVGLTQSLGTGTATLGLEDLDRADLLFLAGANPSSNHPRFMRTLMDLRRRGGRVVVINPARERGLERFSVPSDIFSLLFGSDIASTFLQPYIGGDIALFSGIAKALLELSATRPEVIDRNFIAANTEGFDAYRDFIQTTPWDALEAEAGVARAAMVDVARQYAEAENVVFAWAMGLTHHAHGVDNVQSLVNLALLRGMVGRPNAGLLPLRGHSNVQGIGSIGVTPQLKPRLREQLESLYGIRLPDRSGWDTLACMEAAARGEVDFAWNLGGNLFGSNPDAQFAREAFGRIGFVLYMNTTLNPSHFKGRGQNTLVLPVLARDEEPEPTTQESMFNFIRMSDGGLPHLPGPRSEVDIISHIALRVLEKSPVPWEQLAHTHNVRRTIGSVVSGFDKMKTIDQTREEFHIGGRILHEPRFATATGRAGFKVPGGFQAFRGNVAEKRFCLMTVRSEGQFNTVVYETEDLFRGVDARDVVLMNPDDLNQLGWTDGDRVTVKNPTGELKHQRIRTYPIKSGNVMMYFPEANVLVPRRFDHRSRTPSFKSVEVTLEKEP